METNAEAGTVGSMRDFKEGSRSGMVVHPYHPHILEPDAGGS